MYLLATETATKLVYFNTNPLVRVESDVVLDLDRQNEHEEEWCQFSANWVAGRPPSSAPPDVVMSSGIKKNFSVVKLMLLPP